MEFLILKPNFEALAILDNFESLIWTDRYCGYGDFEVYTAVNKMLIDVLTDGNYIYTKDSEHVMIIEGRQITADSETGSRLIISGRSLESILDRRIIWGQTILTGNFQLGIKKLLDENIITPTETARTVSNFIFEASTDPIITALTIDAQLNGNNLYDVIKILCETNNIGFKITLSDDNLFIFKLYSGVDRSYEQLLNPYVVFSPKFENLISSNFIETSKTLKTVTLVGGEGEGSARKNATSFVSSEEGLSRREIYTDASDISSTIEGGTLTDEAYTIQLEQRGLESLSENIFIQSFDGQVEATQLFKYGEDFFMGDILQLRNEYGLESRSRVTELIRSQDLSGIDTYPTFTSI